jgi:large subunit ribosomal protein L22
MDLIRGMSVVKAEALLNNLSKRPCLYIKRVLKSAVDSADKRFHIPASSLFISLIKADQGPLIKRFKAASMGRATEFLHRTTHILLELDKIKASEKKVDINTEKAQNIKKVKVEDRESKTEDQKAQIKGHKVKKVK